MNKLLAALSFALAVACAPLQADSTDPAQTSSSSTDLRDVKPAGDKAPNCPLRLTGDAQQSNIGQFSGKVLYVDFWASWCAPCLKSFPFMNDLQGAFRDQGLQVLAINMDEKPDDAAKFLTEHPANFSVAVTDNASCAKDFNVQVMPSSYLVDRNGIIRHVHLGFRPGDTPKLREMVELLLAEKPAGQ